MDFFEILIQFSENLLPVVSIIYFIVGLNMLKHKYNKEINYFSLLMFTCAFYSFGYYLELNTKNLELLNYVRAIEFFGMMFIPTIGLLFIIQYTGFYKVKIWQKIALYSLSFTLWLLYLTNSSHHLFYLSYKAIIRKDATLIITTKGIAYYLLLLFFAVFFVVATILLLKAHKKENVQNKKKSLLFLLYAFQLPWIAVIFILLGFDKYIDLSPLTIFLINIVFAINEVKNDMLETSIRVWENFYNKTSDPSILIDNQRNMLKMNFSNKVIFKKSNLDEKEFLTKIIQCNKSNEPLILNNNQQIEMFEVNSFVFDVKKKYNTLQLKDITKEKNTADLMGTFFNSTDDLIIISTINGRLLFANNAVKEKLLKPEQDYLKMNVLDFYPSKLREQAKEIFKKIIQNEQNYCNLPLKSNQDEEIPTNSKVWFGEWKGQAVVFAVSRDLSLIKESENKFEKSFSENSIAMAMTDLENGKYVKVNDAFCATLGYSRDEVIGKTPTELELMTDTSLFNTAKETLLENGKFSDVEIVIKTKNGMKITGDFSGELVTLRGKRLALTRMVDVTESKKKDQVMVAVNSIFKNLIGHTKFLDVLPSAFTDLGKILDISRIYFYENLYDGDKLKYRSRNIIGWDGDQEIIYIEHWALQNIAVSQMKIVFENLKVNKHYSKIISELEDCDFKRSAITQRIQSIYFIPIFVNSKFWGYIGFDEFRYERKYSALEIDIMSVFADALSMAIQKELNNEKIISSEEQFRLLITQMQLGLAVHEIVLDENNSPIDYRFINVNHAFEKITGLKANDVLGKTVLEVLPQTEKLWIEKYGKVALTGESISFEDYSAEVGKYFSVSAYSPKQNQFAVIIEDITSRKNLEKELSSEKGLLETTLFSVGDGVVTTDIKGKIKLLNKVAERLTGWELAQAQGKDIQEVFNIVYDDSNEKCPDIVQNVLDTGGKVLISSKISLVSENGARIPVELNATPIKRDNGEIEGAVLVFRDYSDKKKKQEEIEYLSFHDQLTGLYNRTYYEKYIQKIGHKEFLPFAVLMIDVNGLKLTNDAFGHILGDKLLIAVSNILKKSCRSEDVVVRIGGDEFLVLLPNTDENAVKNVVDRINISISQTKIENIILSVSIGYTIRKSLSESMNEIFMQAEDNMYRHKLLESSSMRSKTIDIIMNTLYEKSNREMLHTKRVSEICVQIAQELDFTDEQIKEIRIAGMMHDIGKIGIPDGILNSTTSLDNDEWDELQRHCEVGYRILSSVNEFSKIADYVLEHHERIDGNGYPKGIKGDKISVQAKIIAIADSYDAMTSDRSYRAAMSEEYAVNELIRCSGTQFDSIIAKLFVEKVLGKKWEITE